MLQAGGNVALPEKLIALYTRHILEGLNYLHNLSFFHRDIKGGNVLIQRNLEEGEAKICDFGVSKQIHDFRRKAQTCIGTTRYMSPELLEGQCQNLASADIWALGATVTEMATGKLPFNNKEKFYGWEVSLSNSNINCCKSKATNSKSVHLQSENI